MATTPPKALIAATIFSPSSLLTPSLSTLGALSTNFLLSTKLRPSIDFTSLMILGFEAASKDWSLSVKRDFSAAGGGASASAAAEAAGAAEEEAAAAGAAKEMSGMLRRDCEVRKGGLVKVEEGGGGRRVDMKDLRETLT